MLRVYIITRSNKNDCQMIIYEALNPITRKNLPDSKFYTFLTHKRASCLFLDVI